MGLPLEFFPASSISLIALLMRSFFAVAPRISESHTERTVPYRFLQTCSSVLSMEARESLKHSPVKYMAYYSNVVTCYLEPEFGYHLLKVNQHVWLNQCLCYNSTPSLTDWTHYCRYLSIYATPKRNFYFHTFLARSDSLLFSSSSSPFLSVCRCSAKDHIPH